MNDNLYDQNNDNTDKIKDRMRSYWSIRAEGFAESRHDELLSYKSQLWLNELTDNLPEGDHLRILDVGCGPGFFEMLLAPMGHNIMGIDLTPDMIKEAKELAAYHNASSAEFFVMDAEQPVFPEGFFDAVISRNLTWALPHPAHAYIQWHRVLKPGGVLLNFDAEYAKGFRNFDQTANLAHKDLPSELVEECSRLYDMLEISSYDRPEWDIDVLSQIGFSEVTADRSAGDRLYGEKDQFYVPDRMFRIRAVK